MRRNMKKLAVFVVATALTMFISVAMVAAFDHGWKGINGEYGFAGGGICIATPGANYTPTPSPNPFDPINLLDPTKVSASSFHSQGNLTFKKDGTGTIDLYAVQTTLYTPVIPKTTPPTILPSWGASYAHLTYPFTYTLGADGKMNWAAVANTVKQEVLNPVTGVPTGMVVYRDHYSLTGWVSADHKTITLATPAPELHTIMSGPDPTMATVISKIVCHESHTLTRLDE